jgi:hypothetical protein
VRRRLSLAAPLAADHQVGHARRPSCQVQRHSRCPCLLCAMPEGMQDTPASFRSVTPLVPVAPLQVADIKRANGLLSDNSMFARDFLAIPTQRLPLG